MRVETHMMIGQGRYERPACGAVHVQRSSRNPRFVTCVDCKVSEGMAEAVRAFRAVV